MSGLGPEGSTTPSSIYNAFTCKRLLGALPKDDLVNGKGKMESCTVLLCYYKVLCYLLILLSNLFCK